MAKYLVKAVITVDGIVEKHDIIGAIFGQTEGLFGEEFDLQTLQDKGRVGRIQVNVKVQGGKTQGEILIPCNLDKVETALLAAMVESVDRVGPYDAEIKVVDIVDLRIEKTKRIINRAVELLKSWSKEKTPDVKEIIKRIEDLMRVPEPVNYGPDNLPAGPGVDESDTVILVEGRADVINLLRYGYRNVIALGGAKRVPGTIRDLSAKKKIILLVDGDHGGDLVLREVLRSVKVDFVARAPPNREVEDLTGRELEEVLGKVQPVFDYLENMLKHGNRDVHVLIEVQKRLHGLVKEVIEETLTIPTHVAEAVKALQGTLEAVLYSKDWREIKRIPVRDLVNEISSVERDSIYAIVLDGIITQRLLELSSEKNVKILLGARIGKVDFKPPELVVLTFNEIL
ncbi:MAG: DNA primase [Desulfurococcaceae archaeon]|jgi:DNA primase|nr:DNA primase [Desulfurococcaceae archaeon]